MNPFIYRGYYFDSESNLFYLNSRYYDSEVGRFISPDVVSILDDTKGQINGLNLYMYCSDNPIIYYDPSGQSFILIGFIIGTIIGAIVVGKYAYNTAKENGANGWELFGWTMLGIIGGGLIGGAIGAILGYFAVMSFRLQYLRDLLFKNDCRNNFINYYWYYDFDSYRRSNFKCYWHSKFYNYNLF